MPHLILPHLGTKLETSLTTMMTMTTGQLAWAGSGSQIIDAQGTRTENFFVYTLRKIWNLQFRSAVIGQIQNKRTNQMFPAERGIPAKVSCATSGLYYLCFKFWFILDLVW